MKNVYYALITDDENGAFAYAEPIQHKVAMSIDLSAEGDNTITRADGIDYISVNNNNGYSGDLSVVDADDTFKKDCLGEIVDEINNIQYEDADAETPRFALLFEFKGDVKNKRHILYNCTCTRPNINGENKESQKEPDTGAYTIKASPAIFDIGGIEKHIVKASSVELTEPEVYNKWFEEVVIPGKGSTPAQEE